MRNIKKNAVPFIIASNRLNIQVLALADGPGGAYPNYT